MNRSQRNASGEWLRSTKWATYRCKYVGFGLRARPLRSWLRLVIDREAEDWQYCEASEHKVMELLLHQLGELYFGEVSAGGRSYGLEGACWRPFVKVGGGRCGPGPCATATVGSFELGSEDAADDGRVASDSAGSGDVAPS